LFIVSITYTSPLEKIDLLIPEHVEFLDRQYSIGNFQLSGRKEPRTGGVIIATVEDREELNQILAQDPFKKENLASYEITEIRPTKSSKALEFLVDA
jgi:uncharacterized protein YciI